MWDRVTRRDFIKTLGGSAAIAGATVGGITLPRLTEAKTVGIPTKWDDTTDVLIIGSRIRRARGGHWKRETPERW